MIYERDELEEKIRALDEKIENAQSQVSFNGRSVSYQVTRDSWGFLLSKFGDGKCN